MTRRFLWQKSRVRTKGWIQKWKTLKVSKMNLLVELQLTCSFQFVKKWGFVGPKTAAPPNGHKDRLGLAETTHLWDILCNAHSEIESNVGCLGIG